MRGGGVVDAGHDDVQLCLSTTVLAAINHDSVRKLASIVVLYLAA